MAYSSGSSSSSESGDDSGDAVMRRSGEGMFVDDVISTSSDEDDEMNGKGSFSLSQSKMLETGVVDTTYAQRTVWLVKVLILE
jgi:hypothetical protein